jgi:hypothetical protein
VLDDASTLFVQDRTERVSWKIDGVPEETISSTERSEISSLTWAVKVKDS